MYVEYTSNNSGGEWRLKDKDWKALESVGWEVKWHKDDPYDGRERVCRALASHAIRRDVSLNMAMQSLIAMTGCNLNDLGCHCCGPPHRFEEYDDNDNLIASGP